MRFQPGQSGNPSGRAKMPPEVKRAFRETTLEAVNTLKAALRHDDPHVRVLAADRLLQRAYGNSPSLSAAQAEAA